VRRVARGVVVAYVVVAVATAALGAVVVAVVDDTTFGAASRGVPEWLADRRTGWLELVGEAAGLTDEFTVVALVGAAAGMLVVTGYGRHAAFLVVSLVVEVAVLLTVATVIGRERPAVELPPGTDIPFTSGFPSGHVAAAVVVYGGVAVVVSALVRDDGARRVMAVFTVIVVVLVAFARLYLGLHDVVDVVAGAAMGGAVLTLVRRTFEPLPPRRLP
jgi:membrane-associated phospholipid phosphatase